MSDDRAPYPCADHDKRVALTEQAVQEFKEVTQGMTAKLDLILAQITRVAVLEEKHSMQQLDVTRAHARIQRQEDALTTLANETRAFINYTKGVTRVLWVLAGAVGVLFIKVLFFAAASGMTP